MYLKITPKVSPKDLFQIPPVFFVDLRPTMLDQSGIYEYIKVNVGIRRLGENGRREKEKSIFLVFNLQNVATQDYIGKYDFRRYRG